MSADDLATAITTGGGKRMGWAGLPGLGGSLTAGRRWCGTVRPPTALAAWVLETVPVVRGPLPNGIPQGVGNFASGKVEAAYGNLMFRSLVCAAPTGINRC